MSTKIIRIACKGAGTLPFREILPFQGKLKELSVPDFENLLARILRRGVTAPIHIWQHEGKNWNIDGHQRCHVFDWCEKNGYEVPPVPVDYIFAESFEAAKDILLGHASTFGKVSQEGLHSFMTEAQLPVELLKDASLPGVDYEVFREAFHNTPTAGKGEKIEATQKLSDRFLVPPFSVLDARQGYWQDRKKSWLSIGIKSEIGRAGNLLGMSETMMEPNPAKRKEKSQAASAFKSQGDQVAFAKRLKGIAPGGQSLSKKSAWRSFGTGGMAHQGGPLMQGDIPVEWSGTSIFDPVLCELIYRWFSPKGGKVLDPFAGGSVRGIVAAFLDRPYYGIELRAEQVLANRAQAESLIKKKARVKPLWLHGDSSDLDELLPPAKELKEFDLVFSCPPYADLEVYSDDPRDLSNMPYERFLASYRSIIARSIEKLGKNRFACFVVGEVREKSGGGFYRNFIRDTIEAFEDAGAQYYNEAILVTPTGTLPLRAGRTFSATRKLGKTHQNVLVFCKGDPRKAAEACGTVEVSLPFEEADELS